MIYFPEEQVLNRKSFDIASNLVLEILVQLLEDSRVPHPNGGNRRFGLLSTERGNLFTSITVIH